MVAGASPRAARRRQERPGLRQRSRQDDDHASGALGSSARRPAACDCGRTRSHRDPCVGAWGRVSRRSASQTTAGQWRSTRPAPRMCSRSVDLGAPDSAAPHGAGPSLMAHQRSCAINDSRALCQLPCSRSSGLGSGAARAKTTLCDAIPARRRPAQTRRRRRGGSPVTAGRPTARSAPSQRSTTATAMACSHLSTSPA